MSGTKQEVHSFCLSHWETVLMCVKLHRVYNIGWTRIEFANAFFNFLQLQIFRTFVYKIKQNFCNRGKDSLHNCFWLYFYFTKVVNFMGVVISWNFLSFIFTPYHTRCYNLKKVIFLRVLPSENLQLGQ